MQLCIKPKNQAGTIISTTISQLCLVLFYGLVIRQHIVKGKGYANWSASPADALFLAGWGWMPLYEITGDKQYLDASKKLALATEKVVEEFVIPPQDYYTGEKRWAGHGINESGFGTQGLSELYRITKDKYYLDLTKRYMKQHLDIYQEANGLWNRLYMFETQTVIPVDYWTRGMGWGIAVELVSNKETKQPLSMAEVVRIVWNLRDHGVYVLPCGRYDNILRMIPPLVISKTLVDKGIDIISEVLETADMAKFSLNWNMA